MSSKWSDRLWHTLGFRLAMWYAVIFVASSLVVSVLTYYLLAQSLRQRDHEIIQNSLAEYAAEYQRGGLAALDRALARERASASREPLFVRVLGQGQQALFFRTPYGGDFDLDDLGGSAWTTAPGRGQDVRLEVATVRLADGTLIQVGKSTESRVALLARFREVLGLVTLTVVAVGLIGGAALTRSALEPIRRLIRAVRDVIQTGRMSARVPVSGAGDPVDELSALFNVMLERIDTLVAGMRGALDNVAHDLRTPMARLRGLSERALQSAASPEEYREALADGVEEADRIITMLSVLMDISEAEIGTLKLQLERTPLARAVADAVGLYDDVAEERGVTVVVHVPADVAVIADPARLRQVLTNLVDNAIKYTPAGGRVEIQASQAGPDVHVAVRDSGVGIPDADLPRIWDRLYRGDASRTERGLGLGLSLVRAVVQAHGGRVEVESTPGAGSTFTIALPAA